MRIFIIILFFAIHVDAKELGRVGNVFDIAEEAFTQMILRRLEALDLDKLNNLMIDKIQKSFYKPKKVEFIKKAKKNSEKFFDPSYVLQEDISLPCGKVLYNKGYRFNPLDQFDFDMDLLFIDGNDRDQVMWLKEYIKKASKKVKILLVDGDPSKISLDINMDVYFDQFGEISKKFGIRNVPAKIWQNKGEALLRVGEYKI